MILLGRVLPADDLLIFQSTSKGRPYMTWFRFFA